MSPEQARGQPLDKRSDVFALGIVLHEMIARRRLFKRDSVLASFEAITKELLILPSQVARDCPPSLDRVVTRALARDPADRYASAADMRRDLLAVVHETLGGADVERGLAKLMQDLFRRIASKRSARCCGGCAPGTRRPRCRQPRRTSPWTFPTWCCRWRHRAGETRSARSAPAPRPSS